MCVRNLQNSLKACGAPLYILTLCLSDPTMKQAANQKAFEHFNKESKRPDKAEGLPKEEADISARYDSKSIKY